jgi:murein L,D-transpeptidase YcbB/YkuD
MKIKYLFIQSLIVISLSTTAVSCNGNNAPAGATKTIDTIPAAVADEAGVLNSFEPAAKIPLDSAFLPKFFNKYPLLKSNQKDVVALYSSNQYKYIWFDKQGLIEQANNLYNTMNNLPDQGISDSIPYQQTLEEKMEAIGNEGQNIKLDPETELLLSAGYIAYAKKVVAGTLDAANAKKIDWNLPRKKLSYTAMLDSVLAAPSAASVKEKINIKQYYLLQEYLKKYRDLEKSGGWKTVPTDPKKKTLKPGDTSFIIPLIRERLVFTQDLASNNNSNLYDQSLYEAMMHYKKRNGNKEDSLITTSHIAEMNVPLSKRIEQIIVNMERCRWIPIIPDSANYILVNIPEYRLHFVKNGQTIFESNVVVGTPMTKTVIFSGDMKYVVFSPYWYVPQSIINKEIKPGMSRNKNYLATHNMEWNGGNVRQKPGPRNSLGLVKFIFPNSNNIYLHDSPSKPLFNEETRAFSHGCIRVAKPKELAMTILADDPNWNEQKITQAMNKGTEQSYNLKKTIPVYIGYFTAWVDNAGVLNFRKDVYARDGRLAGMLMSK